MLLENRKREKIFSFWERFNQSVSNYIPPENTIRKNKKLRRLLAETKASIFRPKLGILLREIWK